MSEEEIRSLLKDYIDNYNWSLIARMGSVNSEYDYVFSDDLGVSIVINPNTKSFKFSYFVDCIFTLQCPEASPVDLEGHFDNLYMKFRSCAERFKKSKEIL